MTKLQVNFQLGTLEAEGSEEFVQRIFSEFKDLVSVSKVLAHHKTEIKLEAPQDIGFTAQTKSNLKSKPKSTTLSKGYSTIPEFFNGAEGAAFKVEIGKYDIPKANEKAAALFIYVMGQISITNITLNHVYTAYRLADTKAPKNIKSVVYNSSSRGGYIVSADLNDLSTNHIGEQFALGLMKKTD